MRTIGRIGLTGLVVALACESPVRPVSNGTGVELVIHSAPGAARPLDAGRVHLEGPTPKTLNATPGQQVTIRDLRPGSYSLVLEGLIGDEVAQYGSQSGIQVVEGTNTPVAVTLESFVPSVTMLLQSNPTDFDIGYTAVAGAQSFQIETATDSAFTVNRDSISTTSTTRRNIHLPTSGMYFVRVRAISQYGSRGQATPLDSIRVQGCFNCWIGRASLSFGRENLKVGSVRGILYAVGGDNSAISFSTLDAYDPMTNSWSGRTAMVTARAAPAVGVANGLIYAIGGYDIANAVYPPSVEAYDPQTNSWTPKAPLPSPRAGHGVATINGILYVVGGFNLGSGLISAVEAYDPVANQWTTRTPLPTPRSGIGVEVINGILYAVGGFGADSAVATVEAYNPTTNTWTARAPMPTPRGALGTAVVNGVLYAIGGNNFGAGDLPTVEAYTPGTNSWTPRASMPTARQALGVGVANGVPYAIGGSLNDGELPTVESFLP